MSKRPTRESLARRCKQKPSESGVFGALPDEVVVAILMSVPDAKGFNSIARSCYRLSVIARDSRVVSVLELRFVKQVTFNHKSGGEYGDGVPATKWVLPNGQLHGIMQWRRNSADYECMYARGKKHGLESYFRNIGDRRRCYWRNGRQHGPYIECAPGISIEANYRMGKKNGQEIIRTSRGIATTYTWKMGRLCSEIVKEQDAVSNRVYNIDGNGYRIDTLEDGARFESNCAYDAHSESKKVVHGQVLYTEEWGEERREYYERGVLSELIWTEEDGTTISYSSKDEAVTVRSAKGRLIASGKLFSYLSPPDMTWARTPPILTVNMHDTRGTLCALTSFHSGGWKTNDGLLLVNLQPFAND